MSSPRIVSGNPLMHSSSCVSTISIVHAHPPESYIPLKDNPLVLYAPFGRSPGSE